MIVISCPEPESYGIEASQQAPPDSAAYDLLPLTPRKTGKTGKQEREGKKKAHTMLQNIDNMMFCKTTNEKKKKQKCGLKGIKQ